MTHWGWYWKVKRQHKPKALCSYSRFAELDSFSFFKNKIMWELIKASEEKIALEIPEHKFIMRIESDALLRVTCNDGTYDIAVEEKPCTYGGSYKFFHCPLCDKRSRKLYCDQGQYACRACLKLGYYTQRLRTSERNLFMSGVIKEKLHNHGGRLHTKPPRMRRSTFQKLQQSYHTYEEKFAEALGKELIEWHGDKVKAYLEDIGL